MAEAKEGQPKPKLTRCMLCGIGFITINEDLPICKLCQATVEPERIIHHMGLHLRASRARSRGLEAMWKENGGLGLEPTYDGPKPLAPTAPPRPSAPPTPAPSTKRRIVIA